MLAAKLLLLRGTTATFCPAKQPTTRLHYWPNILKRQQQAESCEPQVYAILPKFEPFVEALHCEWNAIAMPTSLAAHVISASFLSLAKPVQLTLYPIRGLALTGLA